VLICESPITFHLSLFTSHFSPFPPKFLSQRDLVLRFDCMFHPVRFIWRRASPARAYKSRLSAIGYWLFSSALALLLGVRLALADDQFTITVQYPWMRAVPDVMDSTAVYMVLVNTGSIPAELVGGSTTIADSVAPMITTKEGEGLKQMVGMKAVDALEIPAHGTLVLEPNGNHLMVMGLKEHPKEGARVDFTIKLEPGDHEIHLKVPVSKTPVK
jgi:copper(I)-binding protein